MVSREREKYSYEAKVITFFSFRPSRAAICCVAWEQASQIFLNGGGE